MLVEEIVIGGKNTSCKVNLFTNWELPGKNYGNLRLKLITGLGKYYKMSMWCL